MGGDKLLDQIFNLKFTAKQLARSAVSLGAVPPVLGLGRPALPPPLWAHGPTTTLYNSITGYLAIAADCRSGVHILVFKRSVRLCFPCPTLS